MPILYGGQLLPALGPTTTEHGSCGYLARLVDLAFKSTTDFTDSRLSILAPSSL